MKVYTILVSALYSIKYSKLIYAKHRLISQNIGSCLVICQVDETAIWSNGRSIEWEDWGLAFRGMKLNQLQTTQINGLDETEIGGMRQTSKTKMQKSN